MQAKGGPTLEVVHEGYSCDLCGVKPITGHRYRCIQCHNFDLCAACYSDDADHHANGDHVFQDHRRPLPVTRPVFTVYESNMSALESAGCVTKMFSSQNGRNKGL